MLCSCKMTLSSNMSKSILSLHASLQFDSNRMQYLCKNCTKAVYETRFYRCIAGINWHLMLWICEQVKAINNSYVNTFDWLAFDHCICFSSSISLSLLYCYIFTLHMLPISAHYWPKYWFAFKMWREKNMNAKTIGRSSVFDDNAMS